MPKGYRPTSGADRIKRLRRLPDAQMPLARDAARQVIARHAHWKADLGDLAPDLRPLSGVIADVEACEATLAALHALVAYHEERYDIARGDLEALLRGAYKEFDHRVDRVANLATDYSHLATLFGSMGTAIAEGMVQAKREKKTDKG